ncbi:MAG: TfoX/Sxy family protein [Sphingomonas paucimobilis]
MSVDTASIDWIEEAMAPLGQVTWRRMMGGVTLYLDGVVFAIVDDDTLWFKADAQSDAVWDAAGAERFSMERKDGSIATMNYRRAPDDVLDDAEAMRAWGGLAVAAGQRAPVKKRKQRSQASPRT